LNFLAHCYLSCSDEDLLVGNFIADFIPGAAAEGYSPAVLEGIQLHRSIDSYTDRHSESLELRSILRQRHGKYASVAVDLVWDYYLCRNWASYSGLSLEEFARQHYTLLDRYRSVFPESLALRFDAMVDNDFLLAYNGIERARKSLAWMDRRTRFPSRFKELVLDIDKHDRDFDRMFNRFFPDIIQYVENSCSC